MRTQVVLILEEPLAGHAVLRGMYRGLPIVLMQPTRVLEDLVARRTARVPMRSKVVVLEVFSIVKVGAACNAVVVHSGFGKVLGESIVARKVSLAFVAPSHG